ncbi:MAG: FAD-binding oxidoreductase [Ktedonobacterales bacterium]
MAPVDRLIDGITMYRLTLYTLIGLLGIATVLSAFGLLPFALLSLLASVAFLVAMCWAANTLLARIFRVPTNIESAAITALILACVIDPARSQGDFQMLGWTAIAAMSSKYVLALRGKHLFNPAAIALVVMWLISGVSVSWWIGTTSMLPAVALGGLLLVRKVRQGGMFGSFLVAALVGACLLGLAQGTPLATELRQVVVLSPLVFFGSIMLTEPLTAPPTRGWKRVYGALTGILFLPQIHIGALYSTPELALVVGNLLAYVVSPKYRVALTLKRRQKLSADVINFVFAPSRPLAFAPGQYIECTLGHAHPDSRGNRRYFTLASSPTEPNVQLGVRFYPRGSSFKRTLRALSPQEPLVAGQVAGDFTLPRDPKQKLVLIAGGIGITPYRSMLKYLLDTGQQRDIALLYSAKTLSELVYTDVLNEAQKQLGTKIVCTLTDLQSIPQTWNGWRGRIDARMIQEAVPDYRTRLFYLSGPPEMVSACERVLQQIGVKSNQIKRDFFPGLA